MSDTSTERIVGRLEADVETLKDDVAELKVEQKEQTKMLRQLTAHHNRRKGAQAAIVALASSGFIGWVWEHFHK